MIFVLFLFRHLLGHSLILLKELEIRATCGRRKLCFQGAFSAGVDSRP
jgi:hypothetical protein